MRPRSRVVEDGRTRLSESWLDRVIRPFMAITGGLLLSFCGGNAPGPEGRGSAGEPPDGGSSQGGSPETAPTSGLTAFTVPGRVQAEAFGGFSGSTTSSKGGTGPYGNLQPCTDISGCGQNVGWIGTGEWFSYDLDVQTSVASIDVRVASAYSGDFHLDVDDGAFTTASFNVATGDWQRWATVTTSLSLPSGSHVIKLVADTGGFNVNYLDFIRTPKGPAQFYSGCYFDYADRMLDIFKGSRSDMTPQLCQRLCTGSHYAGVQWYSECWCGVAAIGSELTPDSECNTPCSGDSSQMCGGSWHNSIYFVPEYVGCYTDSATRALPVFKGYRYDMTPQKCEALCEGYAYAGVQWQGECWCGNTLAYQLRPDGECNTACNGDTTTMCGGGWHNSIYFLIDPGYGHWD